MTESPDPDPVSSVASRRIRHASNTFLARVILGSLILIGGLCAYRPNYWPLWLPGLVLFPVLIATAVNFVAILRVRTESKPSQPAQPISASPEPPPVPDLPDIVG